MAEPKYPVGVQSFSEVMEGNYVYVDKKDITTAHRRSQDKLTGRESLEIRLGN